MCTAIAAKTAEGDFLLGRTMDFSYPLDPELFVAAPGYAWPSLTGTQMLQSRFRFMGIGQDISPVVFSDGVNERGFAAAMLYFPATPPMTPLPRRRGFSRSRLRSLWAIFWASAPQWPRPFRCCAPSALSARKTL